MESLDEPSDRQSSIEIVKDLNFFDSTNSLNGRAMPTFEEVFDLFYESFSSGKIISGEWFGGSTVSFYNKKGVYLVDRPDFSEKKVIIDEMNLDEKLNGAEEKENVIISENGECALINYGESERQNPLPQSYIRALLKTEERIGRFEELCRRHKKPYCTFFSKEGSKIKVPAIKSLGLDEYICLRDLSINDRTYSTLVRKSDS